MIEERHGNPAASRRLLEGLATELERELRDARELAPVARQSADLDALAEDARAQLERARTAAVVTLVGSTGAGKSTLLNALVGDTIAVEGEDRPTTSAPVIYRPRDADLGELLDGLPGEAPRVVDYAVDGEGEGDARWTGQVLVDAPDTNSVETLHREVVSALAARSDVLVIVAHRQSIAELSSAEFVDAFAGRRGMLFVLNRADELTPAAREELLAQLRTLAAERWAAPDAPVLAVSAREARRDPADPSWRELVRCLRELASDELVRGVRRRNALGAVARLAELAAPAAAESAALAERLRAATAEGLGRWRADVEAAVATRLELREADLAAMLWNDAAKVWDGPGGYALRAGGLATLGLGAGAALARRNPALAAGAAVGAFAVDRARGALRERGFQSSSPLLPGAGELDQWQRDRLSDARLAAEELFVDRTVDGADVVPEAEGLAELAGRTVEEAWDELVNVTLPRTARTALPGVVHWGVDLPVFALAGWVVWLAGSGLFSGTFVGLDLLMTTAIVALAWLFLCRTVVRRVLRRRGARLLGTVEAKVRARLAEEEFTLLERQRRRLDRPAAAATALAAAEERWRERLRA